MADLGYFTSSGEKITKSESEKRFPKKKTTPKEETIIESYQVTTKDGRVVTRTKTSTGRILDDGTEIAKLEGDGTILKRPSTQETTNIIGVNGQAVLRGTEGFSSKVDELTQQQQKTFEEETGRRQFVETLISSNRQDFTGSPIRTDISEEAIAEQERRKRIAQESITRTDFSTTPLRAEVSGEAVSRQRFDVVGTSQRKNDITRSRGVPSTYTSVLAGVSELQRQREPKPSFFSKAEKKTSELLFDEDNRFNPKVSKTKRLNELFYQYTPEPPVARDPTKFQERARKVTSGVQEVLSGGRERIAKNPLTVASFVAGGAAFKGATRVAATIGIGSRTIKGGSLLLGGAAVIGSGVRVAAAQQPFKQVGRELVDYAAFGLGSSLVKSPTTKTKSDVIDLKETGTNTFAVKPPRKFTSFTDFNKQLFSDKTAGLKPRGRSTSRGRGKKIRARKEFDIQQGRRTFRTYSERTGRYTDYGKIERKIFTREINKSPQFSKKNFVVNVSSGKQDFKVSFERTKVKPKKISSLVSQKTVVNLGNQKALQKFSQRNTLQSTKNLKKLRNRPLVEQKPKLRYDYIISREGQVSVVPKLQNKYTQLNSRSPIRIIEDKFDTPTIKKIVTGRKNIPKVDSDLTLRRTQTLKKLSEKSFVDDKKSFLTRTKTSTIVQTSPERSLVVINKPSTVEKPSAKTLSVTKKRTVKKTFQNNRFPLLKKKTFPTVIIDYEYSNKQLSLLPTSISTDKIFLISSKPSILGFKEKVFNKSFLNSERISREKPFYDIKSEKVSKTISSEKILSSSNILGSSIISGTKKKTLNALATDVSTDYDIDLETSSVSKDISLNKNISSYKKGTSLLSKSSPSSYKRPVVNNNFSRSQYQFDTSFNNFRNSFERTRKTTTTIPPFLLLKNKKRSSFEAFGVAKGKEIKLGTFSSLQKARSVAERFAGTTAARSIKVEETGTKRKIRIGGFKESKSRKGFFVEPSSRAIDTRGELAAITFKGVRASRRKK